MTATSGRPDVINSNSDLATGGRFAIASVTAPAEVVPQPAAGVVTPFSEPAFSLPPEVLKLTTARAAFIAGAVVPFFSVARISDMYAISSRTFAANETVRKFSLSPSDTFNPRCVAGA